MFGPCQSYSVLRLNCIKTKSRIRYKCLRRVQKHECGEMIFLLMCNIDYKVAAGQDQRLEYFQLLLNALGLIELDFFVTRIKFPF